MRNAPRRFAPIPLSVLSRRNLALSDKSTLAVLILRADDVKSHRMPCGTTYLANRDAIQSVQNGGSIQPQDVLKENPLTPDLSSGSGQDGTSLSPVLSGHSGQSGHDARPRNVWHRGVPRDEIVILASSSVQDYPLIL